MKRTLLLAAMLGCLGASVARADEVVIVTAGSATEHDRATVSAAVGEVARSDGWTLRAKPPSKKESESLANCQEPSAPWNCILASLRASGVQRALILTVDSRQTEYGAPMVAVLGKAIAADTQVSAVKQRQCIQCADDKLAATASELTVELLREIAVREGRTVIEVHSTPQGAQVMLDGTAVQVTNAALSTYPGKHVVILELPGFEREIREVTAERGKTTALAIDLKPSVTTGHRTTPPSRALPYTLIGAGAAAVVAGVILYAIDEDPSPSGGRTYRDTAPAGVAVGVAGLAVAGAGAFLWYRASRSRSAPAVVLRQGGAIFAWEGSF